MEIFSQHPYIEQGRMKGHSSLQLHFVIQDDETAVILTETSSLLSLLTTLLVKLVWICCHVISFFVPIIVGCEEKGAEFIPTIMPMSCWQRMLTQLLKLWSDRMKWGIPASLSALSRGSISVKSGDTQRYWSAPPSHGWVIFMFLISVWRGNKRCMKMSYLHATLFFQFFFAFFVCITNQSSSGCPIMD